MICVFCRVQVDGWMNETMKYREPIPNRYCMKLSFLLSMLFGGILSCSQTYALENLAQIKEIKGTPAQSTSYHNVFTAGNAIDGEFEDAGEQTACSYTVGSKTILTAWWKFPLKKLCYVEYLLIYFRSATVNRHVGFSVYVFNDSSFVPPSSGSGYTVFTQNTTTCVERVMNITVSKLTKGIALYISKNPPLTTVCKGYEPFATFEVCEVQVFVCKGYEPFATFEVCEVQVFGCLNENYEDVCQPCPSKCFNNLCDGFNGSCIYGCSNPHKEAPDCSKCVSGYYGSECNQRCGHCTEEIYCNITSGECSEGCKENWAGLHCDKCVEGYYGLTCSSECGYCKTGTFCNSSTGNCDEGFQKHWSEPNCSVLTPDFYCQKCTGDNTSTIGFSAAVFLLALFLLIALGVIIFQRRRISALLHNRDHPYVDNSEIQRSQTYDNLAAAEEKYQYITLETPKQDTQ